MRNPTSTLLACLFAVFVASAFPMTAGASLIGDTVNASVTGAGLNVAPNSALVGAGPEFLISDVDPLVNVDVQDSSFSLTEVGIGSFSFFAGDSLTLSDLDWVNVAGMITGVSVGNSNGVSGLTNADLSFTPNSVTVDLSNVNFQTNGTVEIVLETAHVPEPTSLVIFGVLAVGGVSAYVCRRKRRVA